MHPDNVGSQFYHISRKYNRDSILQSGLRASKDQSRPDENKSIVWLSHEPVAAYKYDVYQVAAKAEEHPITGGPIATSDIPAKDVSLVGHIGLTDGKPNYHSGISDSCVDCKGK
jgi:hypothetical protein